MHKHGHWHKLSIVAVAAVGSLLIGCNNTSNRNSDVVPTFLTVEELASDYNDRIGDEVILEGEMIRTLNHEYVLGAAMSTDADQKIREFRVALNFESDNVNAERMDRCLVGQVLVTGRLQSSNFISVKYVKLLSDARIHRSDSCYHYLD
jgi:hypothetical protein